VRKILLGVAGGLILLAGGYLYADAQDWVPGWITAAPEDIPQAPFITAAPVAGIAATVPVEVLDADAPRPSATVVQGLARDLRADDRTGASTNVSVIDYLDGTVYADLGASDPQVPASTTKLLTAVAAVAELGADFRTTTAVTWDEPTSTLTLVAGGDVMLAAGDGHGGDVPAGTDAAQGWAGLGDLAAQVAAFFGDDAPGAVTLRVDDEAFPGPAWPAEWPEYAFNLGYASPVTGLAVNGGRLTDENYGPRAEDPSLHAGEQLVVALRAEGLKVRGEVTHASSRNRAQEIASVDSAPLAEVARHLLSVSDNTVAEAVARVLALETGRNATPTGAANAMAASLSGLGADVTGLQLYDGAGFSARNQIAPITLTTSMTVARDEPELDGLLDWLPLSGLEGTVEDRYSDTEVAGFWRAKTGSLTGVTAISGVLVTADGRALAVALLADGMPYGQDRPQEAFDEFLAALAQCGCAE